MIIIILIGLLEPVRMITIIGLGLRILRMRRPGIIINITIRLGHNIIRINRLGIRLIRIT